MQFGAFGSGFKADNAAAAQKLHSDSRLELMDVAAAQFKPYRHTPEPSCPKAILRPRRDIPPQLASGTGTETRSGLVEG